MAEPSFLRRLFLCRLDLCDLWRREGGSRGGYECTGCGRLSMLRDRPKPRDGASIFPTFDVDAPMPAPANPPSGGTSATKAAYRQEPTPDMLRSIAPSLDAVPESLERPLIGYLSKAGHRIFSDEPTWWTALYRDPADLNAKGAIVEVEIRVLRVIPEGAR